MWLRRNLKFTLIVINLFIAFGQVLCYLVPYIDPRVYWPFSFFGLAFPFFWLLCLAFMCFWIALRKWFFIISLLTILLGWSYGQRMLSFSFNSQSSNSGKLIKIMSYNVRNFDFYNLQQRQESKRLFLDLFKREQADILCFQEFFHLEDSSAGLEYVDSLSLRLGYPYHYFNTRVSSNKQRYGMAIFSRYPIIGNAKMDFKTKAKNGCVYVDVEVEDTILRIYNVHFQSIQFSHDDYKYFEKKSWDIKAIKKIFIKLKLAFIKRADQAEFLSKHIQLTPYPVILCGDFNDTPLSYSYERIFQSRHFKDAFINKGNGFGSTYVGLIPFLRIDNIFTDFNIHIHDFKVLSEEYSDHYPVVCNVSF